MRCFGCQKSWLFLSSAIFNALFPATLYSPYSLYAQGDTSHAISPWLGIDSFLRFFFTWIMHLKCLKINQKAFPFG
jgi:hypothetical protein